MRAAWLLCWVAMARCMEVSPCTSIACPPSFVCVPDFSSWSFPFGVCVPDKEIFEGDECEENGDALGRCTEGTACQDAICEYIMEDYCEMVDCPPGFSCHTDGIDFSCLRDFPCTCGVGEVCVTDKFDSFPHPSSFCAELCETVICGSDQICSANDTHAVCMSPQPPTQVPMQAPTQVPTQAPADPTQTQEPPQGCNCNDGFVCSTMPGDPGGICVSLCAVTACDPGHTCSVDTSVNPHRAVCWPDEPDIPGDSLAPCQLPDSTEVFSGTSISILCNTCECINGILGCTMHVCDAPLPEGAVCERGTAAIGICEGELLCLDSELPSGERTCQQLPQCDDATCPDGEVCVEEAYGVRCVEKQACMAGQIELAHGESTMVDCNACTCEDGYLDCSERECNKKQECIIGSTPYPDGFFFPSDCNTCVCLNGGVQCTDDDCTKSLDCKWNAQTIAPWTRKQRERCCAEQQVRCPSSAIEDKYSVLEAQCKQDTGTSGDVASMCCQQLGLRCPSQKYDCNDRTTMVPGKGAWCCSRENKMCGFNCMVPALLSPDDKARCCRWKGLNCDYDDIDWDNDLDKYWEQEFWFPWLWDRYWGMEGVVWAEDEPVGSNNDTETSDEDDMESDWGFDDDDDSPQEQDNWNFTPEEADLIKKWELGNDDKAVLPDGKRAGYLLKLKGDAEALMENPKEFLRKFRMSILKSSEDLARNNEVLVVTAVGVLKAGFEMPASEEKDTWSRRIHHLWNLENLLGEEHVMREYLRVGWPTGVGSEKSAEIHSDEGVYVEYYLDVGSNEEVVLASAIDHALQSGKLRDNTDGFSFLLVPVSDGLSRAHVGGHPTAPQEVIHETDSEAASEKWLYALIGGAAALCLAAVVLAGVTYSRRGLGGDAKKDRPRSPVPSISEQLLEIIEHSDSEAVV
eukprot:TRINITY_DN2008_c0_g2_i1.p1 TRINITY_DN2008_c0_g2~~TRINITY_DN2008_c0_g2_i1.p1  ORF type:complete len:913 (+),score=181.33 TRINITY_DN2008_c0_g2_i1:36-2774(+)